MKTVFFENYQETDEMINENPDVYQDHLNRDIIHTLNCFHPCKVFIDYDEFMDDIQKRTMFENLLGELSRFRSVEKEREKILLFDDMFRKLLPDLIRINYYTPDYISYAPDEYWWLHLIESYGSDSIYVKPVLRSRGYDIRRWHDSWPDNRNLWHYELYPNPGPGDYEKWRV